MKRQRVIFAALTLAALFVDLWGSYESSGAFKRWMALYGHDVILCMFLYFFNRTIWHVRVNRRPYVAIFVLSGATLFEFAQLAGSYSGTFDPFDILAYVIGVMLAVGIDKVVSRRQRPVSA